MRHWTGTYLTHHIGNNASSGVKTLELKENWVNDRLHDGNKIKICLPVFGKLIISLPNKPEKEVERIIIPRNGITRTGYVNEIWVPGVERAFQFNGKLLFSIAQEPLEIPAYCTTVDVYDHPYKGLLLSPKRVTIIPYLCPATVNSIAKAIFD